MRNYLKLLYGLFIVSFLAACVNNITFDNQTSILLNVKAEMDAETILEQNLSPGEEVSVKTGKGNLKVTATGTNYNTTLERTMSGSGTWLVEFDPEGAILWKRVASGY